MVCYGLVEQRDPLLVIGLILADLGVDSLLLELLLIVLLALINVLSRVKCLQLSHEELLLRLRVIWMRSDWLLSSIDGKLLRLVVPVIRLKDLWLMLLREELSTLCELRLRLLLLHGFLLSCQVHLSLFG